MNSDNKTIEPRKKLLWSKEVITCKFCKARTLNEICYECPILSKKDKPDIPVVKFPILDCGCKFNVHDESLECYDCKRMICPKIETWDTRQVFESGNVIGRAFICNNSKCTMYKEKPEMKKEYKKKPPIRWCATCGTRFSSEGKCFMCPGLLNNDPAKLKWEGWNGKFRCGCDISVHGFTRCGYCCKAICFLKDKNSMSSTKNNEDFYVCYDKECQQLMKGGREPRVVIRDPVVLQKKR